MLIRLWRNGSIAWRFIATVAMVVALTLGALGLFFAFGGVWAQPPLWQSGVLDQMAEITDMLEAAPPDLRKVLAAAARPEHFSVAWQPPNSPIALALDGDHQTFPYHDAAQRLPRLLRPDRRALLFSPDNPRLVVPMLPSGEPALPAGYNHALGLPDGSWVIFHADQRFWGVDPPVLFSVWLAVLILVTTVISLIATRQLVRPIRHFADAILLFGTHPRSAPMEEAGPAEFRSVISAFNRMQDRIQKLMSYRTAMLAAISHDLRTPLTRIRLRGEFIADPVQQARLFRDVDDLQQMVDGALAFFRGDAQEEGITALDLPSMIQTIIDDFADQGVAVDYGGPARLSLLGRPSALKRAIANVIENAVKYATPPDVGISIGPTHVTIAIRDAGPGIPEDALEQVFNPFFRLETSRNRSTGGVGLGLTAAQSIVREHGGEVSLANRPGGGLEVRMVLPRLPETMIATGTSRH